MSVLNSKIVFYISYLSDGEEVKRSFYSENVPQNTNDFLQNQTYQLFIDEDEFMIEVLFVDIAERNSWIQSGKTIAIKINEGDIDYIQIPSYDIEEIDSMLGPRLIFNTSPINFTSSGLYYGNSSIFNIEISDGSNRSIERNFYFDIVKSGYDPAVEESSEENEDKDENVIVNKAE